MDFQPGDMQFINNYHVLHGRSAYEDDRAAGKVRHLKRLWLETEVLADRPEPAAAACPPPPPPPTGWAGYWSQKPTISRMDALPKEESTNHTNHTNGVTPETPRQRRLKSF